MERSSVTFAYAGRFFTFAEDADKVMKGMLACDCTKSVLIREYCDNTFPILKCGYHIEIVSLAHLGSEPLKEPALAVR